MCSWALGCGERLAVAGIDALGAGAAVVGQVPETLGAQAEGDGGVGLEVVAGAELGSWFAGDHAGEPEVGTDVLAGDTEHGVFASATHRVLHALDRPVIDEAAEQCAERTRVIGDWHDRSDDHLGDACDGDRVGLLLLAQLAHRGAGVEAEHDDRAGELGVIGTDRPGVQGALEVQR